MKLHVKTDIWAYSWLLTLSFPSSCSSSLVWPEVLHGHADPTQDPAPERAVILIVKLLKLRRLADLVEERHVDVWLQQ